MFLLANIHGYTPEFTSYGQTPIALRSPKHSQALEDWDDGRKWQMPQDNGKMCSVVARFHGTKGRHDPVS